MPRYQSLLSRLGLSGQRVATGATQLALVDPVRVMEDPGLVARLLVQPASDFTGALAAATSPFAAGFKAFQGVVDHARRLMPGAYDYFGGYRGGFRSSNMTLPLLPGATVGGQRKSVPVRRALPSGYRSSWSLPRKSNRFFVYSVGRRRRFKRRGFYRKRFVKKKKK